MVAKQLQRLLKDSSLEPQKTPNVQPSDPNADIEDDDNEEETSRRIDFNPFDLLTDDERVSQEEGGEGEEASSSGANETPEIANIAAPSSQLKPNPQKQRKKNSKSRKKKANVDHAEDHSDQDVDEILRQLSGPNSLNDIKDVDGLKSKNPARHAVWSILGVNNKHLKAEEEIRRIFGPTHSIRRQQNDQTEAYAGYSRRIRRLAARGLIRDRLQPLKPGLLISNPRTSWPRDMSSNMLRVQHAGVDSRSGATLFQLALSRNCSHENIFKAVQAEYEQCVESYDPNSLAAFLASYPYHLDGLLTMADVYRAIGENEQSDDLIERCVYVLDCCWPPLAFAEAAVTGQARIGISNSKLFPNRLVFLPLFRYMQTLSRRGLHRTALEVCKLLLQLDPEDPMGAFFLVDYYALRSRSYSFLTDLATGKSIDPEISMLPNIVYSHALALWYQEQNREETNTVNQASSGNALVKAITLYPLAAVKLCEALGLTHTDLSPSLLDSCTRASKSLQHAVEIFVQRQSALWKPEPVQNWLLKGIRESCIPNLLVDGFRSADWANVAFQYFPSEESEDRFAHISASDLAADLGGAQRVPLEVLQGEDAIPVAQDAGARGAAALRDVHPLTALFRSLLPWAGVDGEQPEYENEDDGGDAAL
jgi:tetratricopeptide (TPR) repeat protein